VKVLRGLLDLLIPIYCVTPSTTNGRASTMKRKVMTIALTGTKMNNGIDMIVTIRNNG
jgi:hypothetical protein